jgi:hypothetical protein
MAVEIDGVKYVWDQPICDDDWRRIEPNRHPYRMAEAHRRTEQCAWCGQPTESGIYRRTNPHEVSFPAREDDE